MVPDGMIEVPPSKAQLDARIAALVAAARLPVSDSGTMLAEAERFYAWLIKPELVPAAEKKK